MIALILVIGSLILFPLILGRGLTSILVATTHSANQGTGGGTLLGAIGAIDDSANRRSAYQTPATAPSFGLLLWWWLGSSWRSHRVKTGLATGPGVTLIFVLLGLLW